MYRVELTRREPRVHRRGRTGHGTHARLRLDARASADAPRSSSDATPPVLDARKYRGSGNQELYRFNLRDGSFDRLTTSPANDAGGRAVARRLARVHLQPRRPEQPLAAGQGQPDEQAKQLTRSRRRVSNYTLAHGARPERRADSRTAVFCVWDRLYTSTSPPTDPAGDDAQRRQPMR